MKLDDVSEWGHHEKSWSLRKVDLGVSVDWGRWALPLEVGFGPIDMASPYGGTFRFWGASLTVLCFSVGASWGGKNL